MANILITGTNRGLGLEFTKQYLANGDQVFACARTPKQAEALNQLNKTFPNQLSIHALDINNFDAIESLARSLTHTPIDILISNAGIYHGKHDDLGNISYEDWAEIFRVNTMAAMRLTECFLPHLQNGTEKKIAFITSKMGSMTDNTSGGSYLYRSSKAALNAVVKSLSHDLAPDQIHVAAIHPGWVLTDMGGPNALISTHESIRAMREVIKGLSSNVSGSFLSFDNQVIGW